MNRSDFLKLKDVQGFVSWMAVSLPTMPIDLRFAPSKYVRNGLYERVVGIEGAQQVYQWRGGWDQVSEILQGYRRRLRQASARKDVGEAYTVCEEILDWGGVLNPVSVSFLKGLKNRGELLTYLLDIERLLRLDGPNRLSAITIESVPVFNSGLTKIHAIFDQTGSPILDGRVAAAAAVLYHLYRANVCPHHGPEANHQFFAWDEGQGIQVRNPQMLGSKYFGTQRLNRGKPHEWAARQLKLGWIVRYLLESHCEIFPGLSIEERCHRFEAGLFMMGYDLRSIVPGGWDIPEPPALARKRASQAESRRRKRLAKIGLDVPTTAKWATSE